MREIKINKDLVSYCWLYCGACDKYLNKKCDGCKKLKKTPIWCTIRDCCIKKGYLNCAECQDFDDIRDCKKYNGFIMRSLGNLCGSDRFSATKLIQVEGIEGFARYMAKNKMKRINRS